MRALIATTLGALLALGVSSASAQNAADYPTKPIRWIIDFPAAGVSDILARTVGQRLGDNLGQPLVYDNRPGANGIIANELVARAPADGYTLGFISQPFTLQFIPGRKLGFRLNDFAPVARIADYPSLLVVHPKVPADTLKDFVAWAKKKSPPLVYASSGAGGAQHLAMEVFRRAAVFDAVHVPYNGSGPGMIDLMAGRVDANFVNVPGALPHIRAGRAKAIAIASRTRMRTLPEVPTFTEAGFGFDTFAGFAGAVFPARTPAAIVAKMNAEIGRVLKLPDVQERIVNAGGEAHFSTSEEFAKFLRDDVRRWGPVLKEAGVTPQS